MAKRVFNIEDVFENAIKLVTARVCGMELRRGRAKLGDEYYSCSADVSGSIGFRVAVCAKKPFFERVASSMRHNVKNAYPDELYVNEYFNIFCGNAVSSICKATGHAARMTVPVCQMVPGEHASKDWQLVLTFVCPDTKEIVKLCASAKAVEY